MEILYQIIYNRKGTVSGGGGEFLKEELSQ